MHKKQMVVDVKLVPNKHTLRHCAIMGAALTLNLLKVKVQKQNKLTYFCFCNERKKLRDDIFLMLHRTYVIFAKEI